MASSPDRRYLPSAQAVAVAFCLANPINPACCPTPCPIADFAKLTDYLQEGQEVWHEVDQCGQLANRYAAIVTAAGPNGALASALRRQPGKVTDALAAFTPALPAVLNGAGVGNPHDVAEALKQAMFDPANGAVGTVTDAANRGGRRASAAADEAFNALANGFQAYERLPDVAADGGKQIVAAAEATDARSDLAANSAARQALLDNLGGMQALLTTWASAAATASATAHGATLGPVAAPANGAAASPTAVSLQATADQLNRVRQARLAVNQMDATVSALTALHNERHAASVMLAQYPPLRATVASDDAAIQMRAADAATASDLLGQVYGDGAGAFDLVKSRLLALDTTGWKDGAIKLQAAAAAAQSVVQTIASAPQAYGIPAIAPDSDGQYTVPDTLGPTLSAWLEDDKLERFWQPLRQDAEAAMASLDRRLAEIDQRRGLDITGSAAAGQEQTLLAQFNTELQSLSGVATQGFDDGQKATLASFTRSFMQAASSVQADPAAVSFVTVAWPQ